MEHSDSCYPIQVYDDHGELNIVTSEGISTVVPAAGAGIVPIVQVFVIIVLFIVDSPCDCSAGICRDIFSTSLHQEVINLQHFQQLCRI